MNHTFRCFLNEIIKSHDHYKGVDKNGLLQIKDRVYQENEVFYVGVHVIGYIVVLMLNLQTKFLNLKWFPIELLLLESFILVFHRIFFRHSRYKGSWL